MYDVVADIENYPLWWPQVRRVVRTGERTADVEIRSLLPYSLRVEAESVRQDRAAGILEIALRGPMSGSCQWDLVADGDGTRMDYVQRVDTPDWPLRAARFVPWLGRANHAWMMRAGERALRTLLSH